MPLSQLQSNAGFTGIEFTSTDSQLLSIEPSASTPRPSMRGIQPDAFSPPQPTRSASTSSSAPSPLPTSHSASESLSLSANPYLGKPQRQLKWIPGASTRYSEWRLTSGGEGESSSVLLTGECCLPTAPTRQRTLKFCPHPADSRFRHTRNRQPSSPSCDSTRSSQLNELRPCVDFADASRRSFCRTRMRHLRGRGKKERVHSARTTQTPIRRRSPFLISRAVPRDVLGLHDFSDDLTLTQTHPFPPPVLHRLFILARLPRASTLSHSPHSANPSIHSPSFFAGGFGGDSSKIRKDAGGWVRAGGCRRDARSGGVWGGLIVWRRVGRADCWWFLSRCC